MHRKYLLLLLVAFSSTLSGQNPSGYICTDQFGYLPESRKIAVLRDPQVGYDAEQSFTPGTHYALVNAYTGEHVFEAAPVKWNLGNTDVSSGDKVWHFDFSSVTAKGRYFVLDMDQNLRSYEFEISPIVYNEVLKHAVRTFFYQRAGFEKQSQYAGTEWADGASHIGALQDKNCRLYSDKNNPATELDLSGGWYDAGDFNKYTSWTANYVIEMMKAYIEKPDAWGDNYNIPESGNSIPDLLDEAKWGIDFLLRMQQTDGGVLCIVGMSHASPPSAAKGQSLYGPATTAASLNTASAFAIASKVYRSLNMTSYADSLVAAAKKAWDWAVLNPSVIFNNNSSENNSQGLGAGNQEEDDYGRSMAKLEAACFLFDATQETIYRDYFDANMQATHILAWNFAFPFEADKQDVLLYYTTIAGATASKVTTIKSVYNNAMVSGSENFPAFNTKKDPYLAHIKDYTWGSNSVKALQGNMFFSMISYEINPAKNADARIAAQGFINHMHGVNPFNLVYLSNMYRYGGDNCVNEFYHTWFTNGSSKWDRFGVSTFGPAPGFLTGGPNPSYNWNSCCPAGCGSTQNNAICLSLNISPPKGQPNQKSYKDFNTSWPLDSWSVTENSCGYQVNYIRLLSKFVTAGLDCNGDENGTAFKDLCGNCVGGNTGNEPDTVYCNCSEYKHKNTVNISACRTFTSPGGMYVWTTPGVYHDTIQGFMGCDSMITINLTFTQVNTDIDFAGDRLTANASSATYRWMSCDGAYTAIAGETGKSFLPAINGKYAVEVTQEGCTDTSECYTVELTGLENNPANEGIRVYPNPSSGSFEIFLPVNSGPLEIEIRNTLGKLIRKDTFNETDHLSITINESPGMYFLFIRMNKQTQKVLKVFLN